MIKGTKVVRPTKERLAKDIAQELGLPEPTMSRGSTVVSAFLGEVHKVLTGGSIGSLDTYRQTERLMQALGLTYDPYWDTSEAAPKGGGTVTVRAYSRIRSAVTGIPRCFILNVTDAPVGEQWETDHESTYRYDTNVSGRLPFTDAGPGSRILYYSTRKSTENKMHFVAHAEVKYISPGWEGPWEVQLINYTDLAEPVSVEEVEIEGWNRQHSLTEITWDTFAEIVALGGTAAEVTADSPEDPGGDVIAQRVSVDFPASVEAPSVSVPVTLPGGRLPLQEPEVPEYREAPDGSGVDGPTGMPARSTSERRKDKIAEERAVELAAQALSSDGWTMTADRQKDGVGYDLEFERDRRRLKVEVKGVQGSRLAFNLTPKEAWRAETDRDWVVVVVTNVLSPTAYKVTLLTRTEIAAAKRVVTGYRLTVVPVVGE